MLAKLLGNIIPGWVWIVAGAAALAGFGWWCDSRGYQRSERERAVERLGWAQERANAAVAAASASEAMRATERRWQAKLDEIETDSEQRHAQVEKQSADLGRTVGGLRVSLNTALNSLRSQAASDPIVAEKCGPAIEAAGLYADVSGSLASRGAEIARFADEAFNASEACVRAWETLKH